MTNPMEMSKRDALILLKKAVGHFTRELTGEEYEEIRLILALLEPTGGGESLHCYDYDYNYNGKRYQAIYEFSKPSDQHPTILELTEIEIPDK